MKIIGIVFGGCSAEHSESIRATIFLCKNIKSLFNKYKFKYFYLTKKNKWTNAEISEKMANNELKFDHKHIKDYDSTYCDDNRIISLKNVDVIYNTMMGDSGENGNIMGFADLVKVPIIGCTTLSSALCQNKYLTKRLVHDLGIRVVDDVYFDINIHKIKKIINKIKKKIGYPCFVKPYNLGTCAYIFKADNENELYNKLHDTIKNNSRSDKYLIEKFINNIEVRVFIYEDDNMNIHTNDKFVTKLNLKNLDGHDDLSLFNHVDNNIPSIIREKIKNYAIKIFKRFEMKDYARIDFFVEIDSNTIFFNEANTQPFIGSSNLKLMKDDGFNYADFFDMMIKKNI